MNIDESNLLSGLCVPICTPMDFTGEAIDERALYAHIDALIDAGVDIILACGGTGEFAFLREAERKHLAELSAHHIDGRVKFMVQTSAMSTSAAIEFACHAESVGADGVMIVPPHYEGGPDQTGVVEYFDAICSNIDIPIMLYNIPQYSGVKITPDMYRNLLRLKNVRYLKDSSGDFSTSLELLATGGTVFSGDDALGLSALVAGFKGCMWGTANFMPMQAVNLFKLVRAGDLEAARRLWSSMLPAIFFIYQNVYNVAVKEAVRLSGRDLGPTRRPVRPLSASQVEELRNVLKTVGTLA